jgi:hypothetical protein
MPIQINVDGILVTVSDAAEAAAFVQELRKRPGRRPSTGTAAAAESHDYKAPSTTLTSLVDKKLARSTLDMLRRLQESKNALFTDEIMNILGVSSPNAVGGTTKKINNLLEELGIERGMAYRNPKKPKEPRYWLRARETEKAIMALENLLEEK